MAHYTLHISEMNRGFIYIWYNVVPDHFFKKDWSISYAKFIAIEKRGFKNCKNILFNTVNYYFIWMTLFLHIHKSIVMWWIKRRNKECLSLFLKNWVFFMKWGEFSNAQLSYVTCTDLHLFDTVFDGPVMGRSKV